MDTEQAHIRTSTIRSALAGRTNHDRDIIAGQCHHWRAAIPRRLSFEVTMPGDEKAKGPASYFPSIEKTYGKPVRHWLKLLDSLQDKKHMEQVAYLKSEHKMGHGHANALVAYHRAQSKAPI
jgi:hypothetical protein